MSTWHRLQSSRKRDTVEKTWHQIGLWKKPMDTLLISDWYGGTHPQERVAPWVLDYIAEQDEKTMQSRPVWTELLHGFCFTSCLQISPCLSSSLSSLSTGWLPGSVDELNDSPNCFLWCFLLPTSAQILIKTLLRISGTSINLHVKNLFRGYKFLRMCGNSCMAWSFYFWFLEKPSGWSQKWLRQFTLPPVIHKGSISPHPQSLCCPL